MKGQATNRGPEKNLRRKIGAKNKNKIGRKSRRGENSRKTRNRDRIGSISRTG